MKKAHRKPNRTGKLEGPNRAWVVCQFLYKTVILALAFQTTAWAITVPAVVEFTPDPTNDVTPLLKWNKITDADKYIIEINTTNNFASPLLVDSAVGGIMIDTTYQVDPVDALPSGEIFWHIAGKMNDGTMGMFSLIDSFILDAVPPDNNLPFVVTPADTHTLQLSWAVAAIDSPDADSIGVWYNTGTSFPDSVFHGTQIGLFPLEDTIFRVSETFEPDSLYSFALFVKDQLGNWTDSSSAAKVAVMPLPRPPSVVIDSITGTSTVPTGSITIHYTTTGPGSDSLTTLGWQYSTNNGVTWHNITSGIGNNSYKPANGSSYITWDTRRDLGARKMTSLMVRMQVGSKRSNGWLLETPLPIPKSGAAGGAQR